MSNLTIRFVAWVLRVLLISSATSVKKHKSFYQLVTAKSEDKGEYDIYFMTSENGKLIVDSILIHCNKYEEHKQIAASYMLRCWKYAMQGCTMWCFDGCDLDTALEAVRKLNIDYEIEQIKQQYKEE